MDSVLHPGTGRCAGGGQVATGFQCSVASRHGQPAQSSVVDHSGGDILGCGEPANIGLRPRQAFLTLFEAVEDNDAVTLSSNPTGNFGRDGGDGGESAPLLPWYHIAVKFCAPPGASTNIGQLIKERRRDLGISQTELAERMGVSSKTVRAWEWGNTAPKGRKYATQFEFLGLETV